MIRSALLAFIAIFPTASVWADLPPLRQEATLARDYHGAHEDVFNAEFERVRLLLHQTQLEVSSRLGLFQYQQGFQYPLTVRFDDGAPGGLENTLAYVRLTHSNQGFAQELVVNLDELARHPMDFDTVFYHEMTHAVLNDAIGAEATVKIPHWVQEGLAIYVSGDGEARVKRAAASVAWRDLPRLLWPLEGPYAAAAYPQYYLNVKYILDKGTINALQGFVRDLIAGQSPTEAVHDTLGQDLAAFQQDVRDYSLKAFQQACDRGPYHIEVCR